MEPRGADIGFIGLGVMGMSMAGHLRKAGARLHVYTRTKEKVLAFLEEGAEWHDSPGAVAAASRAVFTMVGYPQDVEEVYFGKGGILETARPGTLVVDTTTSRPDLARKVWEEARKRNLRALDAPVSGGDLGARNATLSIMVGGSEPDFEEARPLLLTMGKTVVRQGPAGSGQYTKMANQIIVAGNLAGAVEALIYAEKAGLDPRTVLDSISTGAAASWQLSNMVPRMLDGNFEPGFFTKHYLKDLRIALESARAMGAELPMLALAESLFKKMVDRGYGDKATTALYLLYKNGIPR